MKKYAWLIALLFAANSAFAETTPLDESIAKLQRDWATAFYQIPEKNKEDAFEKLVKEAHQVTAANPGRAGAFSAFLKYSSALVFSPRSPISSPMKKFGSMPSGLTLSARSRYSCALS